MKAEHEELLEAMAAAHWDAEAMWGVKWERLKDGERRKIIARMEIAYRAAAAERGYVLAKLPESKEGKIEQSFDYMAGWNACLDAIEIVELGDE